MSNCPRCNTPMTIYNQSRVSQALGMNVCVECFKDDLWGNPDRAQIISNIPLSSSAPSGYKKVTSIYVHLETGELLIEHEL